MSDRHTPETDDEAISMDMYCDDTWATVYIKRGGCVVYGDFVLGDFARKLERERDEALEKYDKLATEHMLAINKICNERDEAREMAQQLIHIASHCLGWHDNSNPETIAEAIKRWNAATKK